MVGGQGIQPRDQSRCSAAGGSPAPTTSPPGSRLGGFSVWAGRTFTVRHRRSQSTGRHLEASDRPSPFAVPVCCQPSRKGKSAASPSVPGGRNQPAALPDAWRRQPPAEHRPAGGETFQRNETHEKAPGPAAQASEGQVQEMMQPLRDHVVVRLDESIPSAAKFGLILPSKTDAYRSKDGAVEGENRGTVVSVGPGRRHEETGEPLGMSVSVGDIVRFSELEFPTETVDGRKHVLISEADILWVEEPEEVRAIPVPGVEQFNEMLARVAA